MDTKLLASWGGETMTEVPEYYTWFIPVMVFVICLILFIGLIFFLPFAWSYLGNIIK
jgi:hypothetical protein